MKTTFSSRIENVVVIEIDGHWERCTKKETFSRFLAQNVRDYVDPGITEEKLEQEIESVKEEIWEDYDVICSAFDFYAACSTGDGFTMKLNS